jgi:hypothetical protein
MRIDRLILRRRRTTLALLVALGGSLGVVPFTLSHARQSDEIVQCTNQTIAGAYGFRTAGVQVRPDGTKVDFASIGRYVRDDQGNVISGEVTANAGGTITHLTLTGTYTVSPDCTGSQTSNLNTGAAVHLDFVVVDNGQRLEFVVTDPSGTVWGGTQTKQ